MKKFYFIALIILSFNLQAQIINFPDANFKARLLAANTSNQIAQNLSGNFFKIDANADGQISVAEAQQVKLLNVSNRSIASMAGIENFTALTSLSCQQNQLTSLDISALPLQYLSCSTNQLTALPFGPSANLTTLHCSYNQITSLDIAAFTGMNRLECNNNALASLVLPVSALENLICNANSISTLDLTGQTALKELYCANNQLTALNLAAVNLNLLNISGNPITSIDITSQNDLEDFQCFGCPIPNFAFSGAEHPNIRVLALGGFPIQSLTFANMPGLKELTVHQAGLTALDFSGIPNLEILGLKENLFTTLDCATLQSLYWLNTNYMPTLASITLPPSIKSFECRQNQLTAIDTPNLPLLEILICYQNLLTNLDMSNNPQLAGLGCGQNQLQSLNLSGLDNLTFLNCQQNQLTSVDVSECPALDIFECQQNPLATLFMKNGRNEASVNFSGNPDLQYICADDSQIATIQSKITEYGYVNCHVNSYCSFVPGGDFYTFQGNIKVDSNANGCTGTDFSAPNIKFSISNGTLTSTFICNETGSFTMQLQAGNYTVTPIIENTGLTVSPASANVSFPSQTSPVSQNFCIIPNLVHSDLSITVIPINTAIPGFDAMYHVTCKNMGSVVQDGIIDVHYDGVASNLSTANPTPSGVTTNTVNWHYTNLQPLETKHFYFTLNLNMPTDVPPLNIGDVFTVIAVGINPIDEQTPENNVFTLNQTLVNSYDPNDKTCLEGNVISPESVGDYVHYVIRFENTGTFAAENVVVKDIIDTTKFDINTLTPLASSHSYVTRIEGNKVEFIFENINLPFDDANNDGYVAFKIKTRPTLVTGDTFSNSASIYFDYNFPIVTDPAVTAIQTLGNPDFEFSKYFTLYPNPAKDELNIATNAGIEMKSIAVYNILGQLVLAIPNAQGISVIDVSDLKSGNYFIKINSDKGTTNAKFVKN